MGSDHLSHCNFINNVSPVLLAAKMCLFHRKLLVMFFDFSLVRNLSCSLETNAAHSSSNKQ